MMKKLLGNVSISLRFFDNLDEIIKTLKNFKTKVERKKSDLVNRTLFELIQAEAEPCFLLAAVLQYIKRVDEAKILHHYTFNSFELWLNQSSGLSFDQNYAIRAKIAGKRIERSDYQSLFPIGMGKVYEGSHFVTAHKSPDLDTTVASFWGWVDAFAARVSEGLHVWNLPEGPPPSQIEIEWMFRSLFGEAIFTHLPKTRTFLNLTANDLITQKGFERKELFESIANLDHGNEQKAMVVVDQEGYFLGDWRTTDVEGVRQVIISLSSCLRWFENSLHLNLISVFAKKELHLNDFEEILKDLLASRLKECEPALEFSIRQKEHVDTFLKKVLHIEEGLSSDFGKLATVLSKLGGVPFGGVKGLISKMKQAKLFNQKGFLIEQRPRIFSFLESSIQSLHQAIVEIRSRMEKLDIALKTKYEVFGKRPTHLTPRAEIEEIRNKMDAYSYLTVSYPDQDYFYPIGIIRASELRKQTLGTVSLRDFCNREEMGIPPYLDVISVIDHHKTSLNTFSAPMAILSDVQSSNTIVALKAFEINDATHHSPHFIDSKREYIEYLHFLYAILDDTDLLSKVSALDIQCVASLLNRLKSLARGKKTTVIDLKDLPRNREFPKKGAERILRNEDMYSLYRKVYEYRQEEVEKNISMCAKGEPSHFFADTKEQNGCCRIGQTKLFSANISHFSKRSFHVQQIWLKKAMKIQKEKPEIDLHVHMISTIVNAEEVYKGKVGKYEHQDELWIWVPSSEMGIEHLKRFLSAFQGSSGLKNNPLEVEFLGENAEELSLVFKESFLEIPHRVRKEGLPIAVLKYKAGSLNSRKAMVSPFLPKL